MDISSTTRLVALLGHPVEHSRSPRIQNAAFRACRLDLAYVALDVPPHDLAGAVTGLRALGFAGANVTVPHKQRVAGLLDELVGIAARLRTVNAIVRSDDGSLVGHNTDAEGFLCALRREWQGAFNDSRFLVLGAGGAARAVLAALVGAQAREILIWNRTETRARFLAEEAAAWGSSAVAPVSGVPLSNAVGRSDVVVNATSVGMAPTLKGLPFPTDTLSSRHTVMDLAYGRDQTLFLAQAAERGARVISGLEMLVQQAALSFVLWTGQSAPIDVMRAAVEPV